MKKRMTCLLLAGAMLAVCSGCQTAATTPAVHSAQTSEAASQAPATAEPVPAAAAPAGLLGELPVLYDTALTPSVPAFTVAEDFSNLSNAEQLEYWSDEARQMLLQNGFLVEDSNSDEFYPLYEFNRYSYVPNFVTVDAALHTYHLYFLYLQRETEQQHLLPLLQELTGQMLAESQAQAEALTGTSWENAARRNVAYFGVASALLDPSDGAALPPEAAEELALIEEAARTAPSPVMNLGLAEPVLQEDYTQYIPRSYYTGSEELTRYFKAMMWYGRMAFLQANEDMTRSAVLLNLALERSGARESWQRIYDVTSFFTGASDDANCSDYLPLIQAAYGEKADPASLPGNDSGWQQLQASLETLRPAAINSIPLYEWEDRDESTAGFRFLGQRYTLDADILQNLVYRDVKESADGRQRLLPDALDVPAALGSDRALEILHEQGDTDYPNYDAQMDKMRTQMAQAEDTVWNASLYAAWLNTLRPLTETRGEGWPQYAQSAAWQAKSLSSFLGSWTELKHDTALYSKQAYAEMGGPGPLEADDRGWVETEPVMFGRLAALAQATADGLDRLGLLDDSYRENLSRLAELNRQLMVIAEKELKNELPTDEEFELIRSFGGQLEHFWFEAVAPEGEEYYSPQEQPAALAADVATDPNGTVLQTATNVGTLYVIVNVDGSPRLASGAVYTFYQFTRPADQRMTDQDWWVQLGKMPDADGEFHWQDRPVPAAWTGAFTLDSCYGD